ncbi:MAG: hypothetical protein LEGION0403_FIIPPAGN_02881 [Legionella sp.]|uniref:hypothetical protein n=1 Tax=Legionella sp. TaxID=459 RepID=UPI003D152C3F
MPKNPLAKLVLSPVKSVRKQRQEYVGEYAEIVNNLRVGGTEGAPYTDADKALKGKSQKHLKKKDFLVD